MAPSPHPGFAVQQTRQAMGKAGVDLGQGERWSPEPPSLYWGLHRSSELWVLRGPGAPEVGATATKIDLEPFQPATAAKRECFSIKSYTF